MRQSGTLAAVGIPNPPPPPTYYGIKILRRQNNKIQRYLRFSKKSDEENHFREKLLLSALEKGRHRFDKHIQYI